MAKDNSNSQKRIFNLLKPYIAPPSSWDKIYEWLLGKARVIMIVAEILVAAAFVGKVIVDVQAKNFDDQIKVKSFELSQFGRTLEPNLRKIQNKSTAYINVWNGSSSIGAVIKEIDSYVPNPGANLIIRVHDNLVTIQGDDSLGALSQLEAAMRNSKTFSAVSIPSLSSDVAGAKDQTGLLVLDATIATLNNREQIK